MLVVPAVFVFFYAFNAYILCIVSGFGKCDAQHEEYLVFYLSIPFLIQRKALPYFILNLIGFGFHTSSIVYFPLYFILTKKYHKYVYWGIFLVGNFMVLSHINLFPIF